MLETRQGGDLFFAAGVPWYVALFGRDSIITALETLAFAPDVGRATLMVLARHQGRERNPEPAHFGNSAACRVPADQGVSPCRAG
jgi:glycogen debranching enzyme